MTNGTSSGVKGGPPQMRIYRITALKRTTISSEKSDGGIQSSANITTTAETDGITIKHKRVRDGSMCGGMVDKESVQFIFYIIN